MNKKASEQTLVAQALGHIDKETQAVVLPIHIATTYLRGEDNSYPSGNVYSRDNNPTYKPAEELLSTLEQGAQALLFSSGMAAAVSVFQALRPGDRVLIPKVMYWALRNWLLTLGRDAGLEVVSVDMTDTDAVAAELKAAPTRLLWLETPGNPLWSVSDIAAISALAKQQQTLIAVDSTCATPLLTKPLTLGADIVMHSATKYLNGHSDVIAGALVCAKGTEQSEFWLRVRQVRSQGGAVPSPHDASQLLRGMRTLFLRVRESCNNAMMLATELERHPQVLEVLYPGLPSHSGHAVAKQQMHGGFGGMLSVRLKGNEHFSGEQIAIRTAAKTQIWKRATSLGGVESLIEHRASVEGEGTPCPPDLLRLSAGIETAQDLLDDLTQAMTAAAKAN